MFGDCFFLLYSRKQFLLQSEVIAIYVFNAWFGTVGDSLFAGPPLDFYDTLDYAHGEFFDSVLQVFVYPIPIIVSIFFYRKYNPNNLFYIVLWAGILCTLEWASETFFNLFQYKEWKLWYSFVFYMFVISVNLIFANKVKKLLIL
ncbi:CBO0543 family protein [Bacillus sp. J33]|uniref:CBO0543 family protein n=1 Tax=Bacillus sp. J33 TaxID=935836 RepID=UPI00047AA34D